MDLFDPKPSRYAGDDVWQEIYAGELKNYSDNKIVGTEWYEDYQNSLVEWIDQRFETWTDMKREDVRVLDLGTGNGLFLAHLHSLKFAKLYGVDYSTSAIQCARKIAADIHASGCTLDNFVISPEEGRSYNPQIAVDDIMADTDLRERSGAGTDSSADALGTLYKSYGGPDVIFDKGTLDVFYLRGSLPEMIRQVDLKYATNPAGVLWIVSSGNLTMDELNDVISAYSAFRIEDLMDEETNTFSFAGQTGRPLSVAVFRKKGSAL